MSVRSPFQLRCDAAWRANCDYDQLVSRAALAQADHLESGTHTQLYLVRDLLTDAVKIGVALDPAARLVALQIGTPHELELVDYAPGTVTLERFVHRTLASHRLRGEWFAPHPEVLVVCEILMSAGDLRRTNERLHEPPLPRDTVATFCSAAEFVDDWLRDNPYQLSFVVRAEA